jgi:pyruvate/2-oxoglutarate/acetoin dehydrogenase E1 component
MKSMTFANAINDALHNAMEQDESVICYGLGINDPKSIFGTTSKLEERFSNDRVFDMPTAENGMLGVGIGAAIGGLKPVMIHQRLDFFLLAMDQLVNSAAKWHFMFGGQQSVPITIRLIIGRGWGQGPTHSQSLQALFAHIPGLKVVMPTTPNDAKGMLLESIFDPNPVLFLEHRWLHHQVGDVNSSDTHRVSISKSKIINAGNDITIIALSYQVVESMKAIKYLESNLDISCSLIDMVTVNPIDWETIVTDVQSTGRVLCVDTGMEICSVMSEVVAHISINCFDSLKSKPRRITQPFQPEGTSFSLTKDLYSGAFEIASEILMALEIDFDVSKLKVTAPHDVPGAWFSGPF